MKYPNIRLGDVEAVWNKLGGEVGVEKFLQGKLSVSEPTRNWREQDGVIYLSVTSDGTTGPQWIERLEGKGFRLSDDAKSVLLSPDFKPTKGVTTEIAVLKGMLFKDDDRITKKIRAEADKRKFTKSNAEVACLIRENFSDEDIKEMGLFAIIIMHEPIEAVGYPLLLSAFRHDDGRWFIAYCAGPAGRWDLEGGFAFVSQISSFLFRLYGGVLFCKIFFTLYPSSPRPG